MTTGFGERPVQQVLVFSLFFLNDHLERNRTRRLGCVRDARQRITKSARTKYWAARGKRAARIQKKTKCIELRAERSKSDQDYSQKPKEQLQKLIMGDLQWCTGRSRAPERNSSAPTRGPWRSPFWQENNSNSNGMQSHNNHNNDKR